MQRAGVVLATLGAALFVLGLWGDSWYVSDALQRVTWQFGAYRPAHWFERFGFALATIGGMLVLGGRCIWQLWHWIKDGRA